MTAYRLSDELIAAMREYKDREGVPMAVQIERAVTAWLKERGVNVKADRKRAPTRKRS
jgi:hypothetical protein